MQREGVQENLGALTADPMRLSQCGPAGHHLGLVPQPRGPQIRWLESSSKPRQGPRNRRRAERDSARRARSSSCGLAMARGDLFFRRCFCPRQRNNDCRGYTTFTVRSLLRSLMHPAPLPLPQADPTTPNQGQRHDTATYRLLKARCE
jgi:hypothetical protein